MTNAPLLLTGNEALDLLKKHIAEVLAGPRGFISLPNFRRWHGEVTADQARRLIEGKPLRIEKHGKYGWCISRERTR